jgi:type IV pilus assembly protein PilA
MSSQPPAGYPGYQASQGYPPQQPSRPPPKKTSTGLLLVAIVGGVVVFGLGPCSVMAIYGVRKYLANAKTAEARNVVGQLARLSLSAYERDGRLCPSASRPVPADVSQVRGVKYRPASGEWEADASKRAGFACLGFMMDTPQYFQYVYTSDGQSFAAEAHGDLNGDGQTSTFRIVGKVVDGSLMIAPNLEEISPEE